MKNHLQTIWLAFSRELVRHLAARLGERENAVHHALKAMIPMVLCQMVIRVGEGEGRALLTPVIRADWPEISQIKNVTEVLALLGGGPEHSAALDAGESLLSRLFGDGRPGLEALMSSYAGLRPASATVLLQLVAAITTTVLARYAGRKQLSAVRLSEELGHAKNRIYSWLPADLPRWPGYRRRVAVKSSHAVWAAELARPYWLVMLAVATALVLGLLVLGALAPPSRPRAPHPALLAVVGSDSVRDLTVAARDSSRVRLAHNRLRAPATW